MDYRLKVQNVGHKEKTYSIIQFIYKLKHGIGSFAVKSQSVTDSIN